MKNYTKLLSEQIVVVMDRYNNYEETEKAVIGYGVELFLNSMLKTAIYLLIGFAIGKGVEMILAIAIFGSVRKVSGGRHAKTDMGCFIMTGSIILFAVISPEIIIISGWGYALIIISINCLFVYFAPRDDYFEKPENYAEKMSIKWKSILLINVIFLIGMLVNNYWRMIILMTVAVQGITLIQGGKEHEKKNYESDGNYGNSISA